MEKSVKHLAVIMDGNRRWAKDRGLSSKQGHLAGYERLKNIGPECIARGITHLTVFAFSTENWKRAEDEVGYLMDLFEKALTVELDEFKRQGFRLKVIGRREGLRPSIQRAIEAAESATAIEARATLTLCVNYGGRAEIVDACKQLVRNGVPESEISEAAISARMYWPDLPEPDLIVRTSGEERLSGFLTWEGVYSEIYWCQKHWPDFDAEELDKALGEFASRQRRYGG
jgi:undecaprenyl diphosphate synthase